MTSTRPYLLRAFYDWIVDNGWTPHIVVNATLPEVQVPIEYIEGGQIVLNIAVSAVQGLVLGDEYTEFKARFAGSTRNVSIPIAAVVAIYAKENGRGMVFSEEEEFPSAPPPPEGPKKINLTKDAGMKKEKGVTQSFLKVVK